MERLVARDAGARLREDREPAGPFLPVPAPIPAWRERAAARLDRRDRVPAAELAPFDRERDALRSREPLFRRKSRVPPAANLPILPERDEGGVLASALRTASGVRRERR